MSNKIYSPLQWNIEFRSDGAYLFEIKKNYITRSRGKDQFGKNRFVTESLKGVSHLPREIGKIEKLINKNELKKRPYKNIEVQIKGSNYLLCYSHYKGRFGSSHIRHSEIAKKLLDMKGL